VNSSPCLVELRHVSQMYGAGAHRFMALQDVNLRLYEGEFVALLGPSGCGKSTLLRIITGLQPPTEGQALYRDLLVQGVNPHTTIVFQTFALFPWLTVQQNVEVALKAQGIAPEQRSRRAIDLLDKVGLDGFETAFPRELSGGMRQKVGFARALAVEPELLCLDEPFSALDVLSAESLRGELLELWTSGALPTRAILMVTHNIEEATLLADRIVVMDKGPGRVVAEVKVDLPHPRQRKAPPFLEVVDQVYAMLAGQTQPEYVEMGTAPGEAGQTRALPHIAISDLAGLLERVHEAPTYHVDIYKLATELQVDLDALLRLTETAELLGFATVAEGDITLTPLGETFAEASILARKEIFATRIRRLPMFRWLLAMLRAADKHQLAKDVITTALELDFTPEEATRQVEVAINWGRYAELLAYDDTSETLSLDTGTAPPTTAG
jgi:NitT/TauT family transport system ATP-binding protein